jgi:hypothetical protein
MAGNNNHEGEEKDDGDVTKQIVEQVETYEKHGSEVLNTDDSSPFVLDERVRLVDEKGYTYTDVDGIVYEWDFQRQAWFPRVSLGFFFYGG